MDPNATLTAIRVCLDRRAYCEAARYRTILFHWLDKGGFLPDWGREPLAAAYCARDARFTVFALA